MQYVGFDGKTGAFHAAISLGDAAKSSEGQQDQRQEGVGSAQDLEPAGDFQKRSQQNRPPSQSDMYRKIQYIEKNHVASQGKYTVQCSLNGSINGI